jgi:hypothetical protein
MPPPAISSATGCPAARARIGPLDEQAEIIDERLRIDDARSDMAVQADQAELRQFGCRRARRGDVGRAEIPNFVFSPPVRTYSCVWPSMPVLMRSITSIGVAPEQAGPAVRVLRLLSMTSKATRRSTTAAKFFIGLSAAVKIDALRGHAAAFGGQQFAQRTHVEPQPVVLRSVRPSAMHKKSFGRVADDHSARAERALEPIDFELELVDVDDVQRCAVALRRVRRRERRRSAHRASAARRQR